uniref:Uncharacterized protein n=1 Tax=Ditylenchus dipsaci TaxID=166011 RepID=A0A915EVA5_9BILA
MYKGGSKLGCFPLVVNYDMPSNKQKYYKRVCCSSGQTGVAITFLEEHEMKKLKEVEETYGIKIEKMPVHSQK